MPWCPKCKNEYRNGIKVCADCGCELVEEQPKEVNYECLCVLTEETAAKKAKDYFDYSKIDCYYEYQEKEEGYALFVPADELVKAKKAFQAFYMVEASNIPDEQTEESGHEQGLSDEPEDTAAEQEKEQKVSSMLYDGGTYEKRSDKSKDYKSTAGIFLFFGFAGLVFVLLNYLEVFTVLSGPLPLIVMTVLFIYFIYVGFNSIGMSKKASTEAVKEEEMTKEINHFLSETITDDFLSSNRDESESEELNFLHITDEIKKLVIAKFGELNSSYLDFVVEEYYNKNIDHSE